MRLFIDIMTGQIASNPEIRNQMKESLAEFADFVDTGLVGFADMQMARALRNIGLADRLIQDLFDPEVLNDPRTPYREKVRLLGLITQDTKMRIDAVKDGRSIWLNKEAELKAVEIEEDEKIDDLILSPEQRANTISMLRKFITILENPPDDIVDAEFDDGGARKKKVVKRKRESKGDDPAP